jgi:hypothetical protein
VAKDYTNIANTALRLVEKYGRSMVVLKFVTTPANESKPWEGAEDPREEAEAETINAVSVSTGEAVKLGMHTQDSDMVKRSDQILIVAPGAANQIDLSDFNEVADQGVNWKITMVEKLQPASTILLFYIGIKR